MEQAVQSRAKANLDRVTEKLETRFSKAQG